MKIPRFEDGARKREREDQQQKSLHFRCRERERHQTMSACMIGVNLLFIMGQRLCCVRSSQRGCVKQRIGLGRCVGVGRGGMWVSGVCV